MKLSKKESLEARQRAKAYEANMAVEGIEVHPDDQALLDRMTEENVGYDEGVQMAIDHLRDRGVIPAAQSKPVIVAE